MVTSAENQEHPIFDTINEFNLDTSGFEKLQIEVIQNIEKTIDNVKGAILYKIINLSPYGEPNDDSLIEVVERRGQCVNMKSRTEHDKQLKGTKRIIVSEKKVYIGKGRKDGYNIIIIPFPLKDKKNIFSKMDLLLLHPVYKMHLTLGTIKKALGGKYEHIRNVYQESIHNSFDDLLSKVDIESIFGNSAEKIGEMISESPVEYFENGKRIIRAITFDHENLQAGIGILNYFSEIIRVKYSDKRAKVKIEQNGFKVTMIIETYAGDKEIIEKTLQEYIETVTGIKPISELLPNVQAQIALQHKLEMAYMEIKHTKELYAVERNQLEQRVTSLEKEIDRFHSLLNENIKSNQKIIEELWKIGKNSGSIVKKHLKLLERVIESGLTEDDEFKVKRILKDIHKEDPNVFSQIYDLFIKGSISGAAGNFLYYWLTTIVFSLPK